jgi:hypothetical protein
MRIPMPLMNGSGIPDVFRMSGDKEYSKKRFDI